MKSKFFFAASVLMSAFTLASFTACSSDDEEENGGNGGDATLDENVTPGPVPSPLLTDKDGNKIYVSSINNANRYSFTYDENGLLTRWGYYAIQGSSFIVTSVDDEDEGWIAYIQTNGDGLITKIKTEYEWKEDENNWDRETTVALYSYNEAKQLVSMSVKNYSEGVDEGDKGGCDATGTLTNTWTNGNLTQSVFINHEEEWWYEGGKKEVETDDRNITRTFSYGDQVNPLKQVPVCLEDLATGFDSYWEPLCLLGLFGVGPEYMPTSESYKRVVKSVSTEEDVDDYSYEESHSNNFTFTFNSNGTINTETHNNTSSGYQYQSTYTWRYGLGNRAAVAKQAEIPMQEVKKMFPARSHRRHNK